MSIHAVSWAIRSKVGSPTQKLVLIAVANYADEHGFCWPSTQRIAADTQLCKRSIITALAELERDGFIHRQRQDKNGIRTVDVIELMTGDKIAMQEMHRGSRPDLPRGAGDAPRAVQQMHHRGARDAPSAVQEMHPRGAGDAPSAVQELHREPSYRTIIEPSYTPRGAGDAPRECEKAGSAKPKKSAKGPRSYTDTFEWFWDHYPRKTGVSKADAFDAFDKLSEDEQVEAVNGAEAYASLCTTERKEPRYIAHPTTFINQRRWETLQGSS